MSEIEVRTPAQLAEEIRGVRTYLDRLLDDPARFATTLMVAARRQPQILQCEPQSVVGAALVCAQLELMPGPADHIYLIPRRNKHQGGRLELTTLLGYKGMKTLAERHPVIASVETGEVYTNDDFEYVQQPASLEHVPNWTDRGEPYLWYAIAHRTDGARPHIAVIDLTEVERRRAFSQSPNKGPWVENPQRMRLKSAVRALWPELPSSLDMQLAARVDDSPEPIRPSDLGVPELRAGEQETEPQRDAVTVRGRIIDEGTGEVIADGEIDDDPPEQEADDAAGPGKPADPGAGAHTPPAPSPAGPPATEEQRHAILRLQAQSGMNDDTLTDLIWTRFGTSEDDVKDAVASLTAEQAGRLIAELQGTEDIVEPADVETER